MTQRKQRTRKTEQNPEWVWTVRILRPESDKGKEGTLVKIFDSGLWQIQFKDGSCRAFFPGHFKVSRLGNIRIRRGMKKPTLHSSDEYRAAYQIMLNQKTTRRAK